MEKSSLSHWKMEDTNRRELDLGRNLVGLCDRPLIAPFSRVDCDEFHLSQYDHMFLCFAPPRPDALAAFVSHLGCRLKRRCVGGFRHLFKAAASDFSAIWPRFRHTPRSRTELQKSRLFGDLRKPPVLCLKHCSPRIIWHWNSWSVKSDSEASMRTLGHASAVACVLLCTRVSTWI